MTTHNASSVSVEFNKEINGFLNDTTSSVGRELKLAVAIYHAPETFNIADILSGKGAKKNSRREAMSTALAAHSTAFADKVKAHKAAPKAKSAKSMAQYQKVAEAETMAKAISATLSMFERALRCAYFLKSGGFIVTKLNGNAVTMRATRDIDEADVKVAVGETDLYTRANVYNSGHALTISRGLDKKATAAKSGAGTAVTTDTKDTVSKTALMLAETVSAMPDTDRANVSVTPDFEKTLALFARARFASDGVINVSDIVDFLRKSDALQGVRIDDGKPAAVRKPRAPAGHRTVTKAA